MSRVAAYARVSDPRQVERWSLPSQRDAIAAYCRTQSLDEPLWYIEDGHTAIHDDPNKRPTFRQLLIDAEARRFSTLIVVDIDRFSRSVVAGLTAAARFEQAGVRIVFLQQPAADVTTPDGELSFTLHAMVARYESRQKGRRVRAAIDRMRAEGKHYGAPPFGARKDSAGRLEVDPAQADLLSRILDLAAQHSANQIAELLNHDGVPSPGMKRRASRWGPQSGHWHASTIAAIVRHSTWLATQPEPWPTRWLAAMQRPRLSHARRDRPTRLLTGLLRCQCGGTLTYGSRRGPQSRLTLMCHGWAVRGTRSGCPHRKTYADVYEAQVVAAVLALPDPTTWRLVEAPHADAARLAAWTELQEDRRRLDTRYKLRLIGDVEVQVEARALDARAAALAGSGGAQWQQLYSEWPALQRAFPSLPSDAQNAVLRAIVDHILIAGSEATVVWQPSFAAVVLPQS